MKSQKFTNLIWLFSFTVSKSAVDSFILKTGFEYKAAYVLNVFKLVLNTIRLSKVDCVQKNLLIFYKYSRKYFKTYNLHQKKAG